MKFQIFNYFFVRWWPKLVKVSSHLSTPSCCKCVSDSLDRRWKTLVAGRRLFALESPWCHHFESGVRSFLHKLPSPVVPTEAVTRAIPIFGKCKKKERENDEIDVINVHLCPPEKSSLQKCTYVCLARLPFFDAIAIDVPFVVVVGHVGVADHVVGAVHAGVQ